ncbi:MAG TPA: hypothetical protein VIY48_14650 [Candidatus Paceibacterota bacterium]
MARKKTASDYLACNRCGNCKHWRRLDDSDQMPAEDVLGECLRYPPTVTGVEDGEAVQTLPICEAQHWCGEHGMPVN